MSLQVRVVPIWTPSQTDARMPSPRNAYTLLKVLADSFGKGYLETALDT